MNRKKLYGAFGLILALACVCIFAIAIIGGKPTKEANVPTSISPPASTSISKPTDTLISDSTPTTAPTKPPITISPTDTPAPLPTDTPIEPPTPEPTFTPKSAYAHVLTRIWTGVKIYYGKGAEKAYGFEVMGGSDDCPSLPSGRGLLVRYEDNKMEWKDRDYILTSELFFAKPDDPAIDKKEWVEYDCP